MIVELKYSKYCIEYIEEKDDYKVFLDKENNFNEKDCECTNLIKKNISKEADELIKDLIYTLDIQVRNQYGFYN